MKEYSSLEEVLLKLQAWSLEAAWKDPFYHVWHLTYEGKAIELVYKKKEALSRLSERTRPIRLSSLQGPSFNDYKKRFNKGYQHLLKGDCYQFNLTGRFEYTWPSQKSFDVLNFAEQLWQNPKMISAYAHLSFLPQLNWALVSNSPECLFDVVKQKRSFRVLSRPIKGTLPDGPDAWEKLKNSKKNRGELNMITDLIRNDLSKIENPRAVVLAKALPLKVPGLIHQYSLVACDVSPGTSLKDLMAAMFPGGSITGAPKIRVCEILSQLEKGWPPRSFYTGTTLVFGHNQIKASINIRTAEIDLKSRRLIYGAGGGITLKSKVLDEYEEMQGKLKSFLSPFLSSDKIRR